jgi:hypothetical protein
MYCKQTQKMLENLERLSIHSLGGSGKAASIVLPNEDSRCAAILRKVVRNLTDNGQQGKAASIVSSNEVAQLKKYLSRRD